MTQSEGSNRSSENTNQRFCLPSGNIEHGRSRPKRKTPKRHRSQQQLFRRLALGLATFLVSLGLVAFIYGFIVSPAFRELSLENGTTAAVALLIGCFTLPLDKRLALSPQRNLMVCLFVLAITPWTYQLGNQQDLAGIELAPGFNFVFEILLACLLYRLAVLSRSYEP